MSLHEQGQLAQAARVYREILATEPDHPAALHWLGVIAYQNGDMTTAVNLISRSLAMDPGSALAHANLGNVYAVLERYDEGVASYERAIALRPDHAESFSHRGSALTNLHRLDEALESFSRALALRPDYAEAWSNRAVTLHDMGRFEEAMASCDRAIALMPDFAAAHYNRGIALNALCRFDEALDSYRRAVALRPDHPDAHLNLGLLLSYMGRCEEALGAYDRAIALRPNSISAHIHRSGALAREGRIAESLAYDRELARNPAFRAEADYHSADTLLLNGQAWEEGWKFYEARRGLKRRNRVHVYPHFPQPEWLGDAALAGRTLFVHGEQGFGDHIQFGRFMAMARRAGAQVIFSPSLALSRLFRGQGMADEVLAPRAVPKDFDLHIPLVSMPKAFATRPDNIPAEIPYLHAEPELAEKWRRRIGAGGFRIGLCWAGSTYDAIYGADRSFALRHCAALAGLPGVRLISLQKGKGVAELSALPAGMTVESLGGEFDAGPDAFVDAAAVMASLDLVITCDTAIAHLAGALGRPVWVALKRHPEWRWGTGGETSPWYPTMTLFRQQTPGVWETVFAAMRARLEQRLRGS